MRAKKQRRFTQKLFLTYSAFLLGILLCIFAVVLIFSYREQYITGLQTRVQLASKTAEQVDASLQGMDRIINGLLFSKTFIDVMKDEDAMRHYTDYSRRVLNLFVAMDAPLFPTHRIIAFGDTVYYNLSKEGENQGYIQRMLPSYPWRESARALRGAKLILPPHPDPFDPAQPLVYSVVRGIYDGNMEYGVVEVQNRYERLAEICRLDAHIGMLTLYGPDGEQVFPLPGGGTATGGDTQPPGWLFASVQERAAAAEAITTRGYCVAYGRSEYSGWTAVIYCPASAVVSYALQLTLLSVAFFLLLTVGAVVTIRLITNRLTAPLVDLNQALTRVSLDNLELSLPQSYGIVEIETINRSFQMMFAHLKEAIAKNVQLQANEERAKYLALQSQMNPHTIYNTIGMIESVSYMHGDKEVSGLLICFSQMLRYISDYDKRSYTVSDELQHLGNYATLIQKRYEDRLQIAIDADPILMGRDMPKFTLQPLVENAVKHGFGDAHPALCIRVSITPLQCGFAVTIQDDGKGFSDDTIAEIDAQFAACRESLRANDDYLHHKIGKLALANIYIRCRILYGDGFSLTVGNHPQGGGMVRLVIDEGGADVPDRAD